MKDFKYILRDIMPCWYELSWRDTHRNPALAIRVHKDFIKQTKPVGQNAPIVIGYAKNLELGSFCGDLNNNFGFEDTLIKNPEDSEFIELIGNLPKLQVGKKETCFICNGSGRNNISSNGKCEYCNDGFQRAYVWHKAQALSASISILFELLLCPGVATSSILPQLLTVQSTTFAQMSGYGLYGTYSIPLIRWFKSINGKGIEQMTTAMIRAYKFMDRITTMGRHEVWNRVESPSGWFNVSCPGDACGLCPSSSFGPSPDKEKGYEFNSHNVDNPLQQLTLLAGLAALHDKARKEIG